tara:strand:- start:1154 stop:1321 length:168 start_codon:yes stop_codon:yes gene_type:complete
MSQQPFETVKYLGNFFCIPLGAVGIEVHRQQKFNEIVFEDLLRKHEGTDNEWHWQ